MQKWKPVTNVKESSGLTSKRRRMVSLSMSVLNIFQRSGSSQADISVIKIQAVTLGAVTQKRAKLVIVKATLHGQFINIANFLLMSVEFPVETELRVWAVTANLTLG